MQAFFLKQQTAGASSRLAAVSLGCSPILATTLIIINYVAFLLHISFFYTIFSNCTVHNMPYKFIILAHVTFVYLCEHQRVYSRTFLENRHLFPTLYLICSEKNSMRIILEYACLFCVVINTCSVYMCSVNINL